MRAFLSVYDKTGVADLARGLSDLGWELISSGGTAGVIADAGVPVTTTEEYTGLPAILGHRVATLHPRIHGGLLADPDDPEHRADMAEHGIEPFDLVVANLYPFGGDPTVGDAGGVTLGEGADLIDIGGPAMVRAAAKNHARVAVVTDPDEYDTVLDEIRSQGNTTPETRRRLARDAFAHTAAYDAAVVTWFDQAAPAGDGEPLPATVHLSLERVGEELRYGENPHQRGARYRVAGARTWLDHATQHSGLALSYLNIFDADAAWAMVHDLGSISDRAAAVIVKHANPCGAAVASTLADAYQRAYECDPRSAFGGIVALNRVIDGETAEAMVAAAQADVVIAPAYGSGAVDALVAKRKNTRLLEAPALGGVGLALRQLNCGAWLAQETHSFVSGPSQWQVVTERHPTDAEMADAIFAWRVCGWVKSNSIVLAAGGVAWGIGAGQQNRVEAGQLAAVKADGRASGGACASDAFYPFPDGIEAAADAGVAVVIQPGGAMRDEENIERADELGLAMIFTGERHFLH